MVTATFWLDLNGAFEKKKRTMISVGGKVHSDYFTLEVG